MSAPTTTIAYTRHRWIVIGLTCVIVLGPVLSYSQATANGAMQADRKPTPFVTAPLSGSITAGNTTWATVVMGKIGQQLDLFWQLFSLNPTTSHLNLVTPPGVADNGGIMVASSGSGSSALAGFGTSQDLAFSPLALTDDIGKSWSPGGVPNALVKVPSALGFEGTHRALALVNSRSQAVLSRSGSLTSWKTLVTRATLATTRAGNSCAIGTLEAVAVRSDGSPLIGASCQHRGIPGVFTDTNGTWHLIDISLPTALNDDAISVLRLQTNSALLAGEHDGSKSIIAAWQQSTTGSWKLSPPLALSSTSGLIASGTGPGTTQFVLVHTGAIVTAEIIDGPGTSWHSIRPLPKQSATIAFSAVGQIEALSVDDTVLRLWRLASNGLSWTKVQSITVPLSFGSSS